MPAQPKTRTFSSVVGRVLGLRLAVFGAAALTLALGQLVGQALVVDPSAHSAALPAAGDAAAAPAWTPADASAYPGCVASSTWPAGKPADFVVVHDFRAGHDRRLAFDRAWRLNHDDTEVDDVWVVGVCGTP